MIYVHFQSLVLPARAVRYVFLRLNTLTNSTDKEAGAVPVKFFGQKGMANQRWDADVGAGGRLSGSNSREAGRSLDVD
jgi:hypothetical protein